MNPLRKRFFGDTVVAQRYTGEAMGLLDALHDQMRMSGVDHMEMRKVLGNGVELKAISKFGQDEVHVRVLTPRRAGGAKPREYCVWEDDAESFTEPKTLIRHYGPYVGVGSSVHMGGQVVGSSALPEPYDNQ